MAFNPNIPNPKDKLSASQPVLRSNNQDLDTTFGIDHYPFSDGTANNGTHKYVTTPTIAIPTTTSDPKLYGHEVASNIGTIQFSRGANDMSPTPLTSFNGLIPALAASTNVPILDFTGVTTSVFRVNILYVSNPAGPNIVSLFTGSVLGSTLIQPIKTYPSGTGLPPIGVNTSGSVLNIINNTGVGVTNVYWFIEFLRLE